MNNTEKQLIHFYPNEEWKEFLREHKSKFRYAVSNFGRVISFTDDIKKGRLLKGSKGEGYACFKYKILVGKKLISKNTTFHRIVAENFLTKISDDQVYVMHIDRNKSNNHVGNLKWVTQEEMTEHNMKNPKFKEAHERSILTKRNRNGHKLNSTTVKLIKKKIMDPNRKTRMKLIAKQFGISEMQLYRIKSGENWGHVTI
jgi:hypothetical protein